MARGELQVSLQWSSLVVIAAGGVVDLGATQRVNKSRGSEARFDNMQYADQIVL